MSALCIGKARGDPHLGGAGCLETGQYGRNGRATLKIVMSYEL